MKTRRTVLKNQTGRDASETFALFVGLTNKETMKPWNKKVGWK